MTIEGELIGVNQMTDQAWAYGPGKLVQLTDRSMLTDKAEGEEARPTTAPTPMPGRASSKPKDAQTIKPKPRTRAGKLQTEKVPLVITWGEKMLFYGRRSIPRTGRPPRPSSTRTSAPRWKTACSTAKIMTTYTDQPIPLADLGKMSQAGSGSGAKAKTNRDAATETRRPRSPSPT